MNKIVCNRLTEHKILKEIDELCINKIVCKRLTEHKIFEK